MHRVRIIYILTIIEPFRAPTSVHLTHVNNQPRQLTFTWDTVESSCPSLQYRVNATGCGTCTSTSMSNTTTCVDYNVTRDQLCTFAVQTVICDDIVSLNNASIQVPLKGNYIYNNICLYYYYNSHLLMILFLAHAVPDMPSYIKIVPSYSHKNGSLLQLNTSFSEVKLI